jgi:hypothetical protein
VTRFWPVGEAAQADYEALRSAVLARTPRCDPAAARFERAGLWGLIRRPAAEPVFLATVMGALRPPWSPYGDPRLDALGGVYQFVLAAGHAEPSSAATQEVGW